MDPSRSSPRVRIVVDATVLTEQRIDSVATPRDRAVVQVGGGAWGGMIDEVRLRRWLVHPEAMRLEWGTGRPDATVVWWGN